MCAVPNKDERGSPGPIQSMLEHRAGAGVDHGLQTCEATHNQPSFPRFRHRLYRSCINSMFNFRPTFRAVCNTQIRARFHTFFLHNNLTTEANRENPGRRFTSDSPPTLEILGSVGGARDDDDAAAMGEGVRNALPTSTAARRIAAENKNDRDVGMAARVVVCGVS